MTAAPADKPKVRRQTPKASDLQMRMGMRKNEVIRLGKWRAEHGIVWEDAAHDAAVVLADCMTVARRGFDVHDLMRVLKAAKIPATIEQAVEAIGHVEKLGEDFRLRGRRYYPFDDAIAGQVLGLMHDERRECKITTMRAVDETAAEREAYVKDSKKKRDREAKRRKRLEAGMTPRSESITHKKPWEAFGWKRSKWYAMGKPSPDEIDRWPELPQSA